MESDEDEYDGDGGYISANNEEDEYRVFAQSIHILKAIPGNSIF